MSGLARIGESLLRTDEAIKAARMSFSRTMGWGSWGRFDNLSDPSPDSRWYRYSRGGESYDPIRAAGDIRQNAVVAICAGWVASNLPQARMAVYEEDADGVEKPVGKHPIITLLQKPNPYYGRKELLGALAFDYRADGNALARKIRDRSGRVKELWWIPRHLWFPGRDEGSTDLLTHYIYRVDEREERLEIGDVIHLRYPKFDPANPALGRAPLRDVIPEIGADNGISIINGALVAQGGMPSVIIAPKVPEGKPPPTPDQAEKIRATHQANFAGPNAGRAMVLTFEAEVHKTTFSPEEMQLDTIGNRPMSRICAAFGLNTMALHLDSQGTPYANDKEAREAAWEECIVSMLEAFAEDLTRQLLPDFDTAENRRVGWDYGKVRPLREDEDAKSQRARAEFECDGITLNEFREKIGEAAVEGPEGEMFFSQLKASRSPQPPALEPGQEPPESTGDRAAQAGREAREARPNPNGKEPAGAGANGRGMNGKSAKAELFTPKGADQPLPPLEGAEEITEAEIDAAIAEFNERVPERFEGLLEATEVTNGSG
jgi:HK97 family phage portal protein